MESLRCGKDQSGNSSRERIGQVRGTERGGGRERELWTGQEVAGKRVAKRESEIEREKGAVGGGRGRRTNWLKTQNSISVPTQKCKV